MICDSIPNKISWKYVGAKELQKILMHKIGDGHTFPLNPKWVLCDPGWKEVYDKLMASDRRDVQESLKVWFPPESGIRETIEQVYAKHPRGFCRDVRRSRGHVSDDAIHAMELAELELERFISRERGKSKIRAIIRIIALARTLPSARAEDEWNRLQGHPYCPPRPPSSKCQLSRQIERARVRASMLTQSFPQQRSSIRGSSDISDLTWSALSELSKRDSLIGFATTFNLHFSAEK